MELRNQCLLHVRRTTCRRQPRRHDRAASEQINSGRDVPAAPHVTRPSCIPAAAINWMTKISLTIVPTYLCCGGGVDQRSLILTPLEANENSTPTLIPESSSITPLAFLRRTLPAPAATATPAPMAL